MNKKTIILTDIIGYSILRESLGEELAEVVKEYQEVAGVIRSNYAGILEQEYDSEILVSFDNAVDAVSFANHFLRSVRSMRGRWRLPELLDLPLRIAVDTINVSEGYPNNRLRIDERLTSQVREILQAAESQQILLSDGTYTELTSEYTNFDIQLQESKQIFTLHGRVNVYELETHIQGGRISAKKQEEQELIEYLRHLSQRDESISHNYKQLALKLWTLEASVRETDVRLIMTDFLATLPPREKIDLEVFAQITMLANGLVPYHALLIASNEQYLEYFHTRDLSILTNLLSRLDIRDGVNRVFDRLYRVGVREGVSGQASIQIAKARVELFNFHETSATTDLGHEYITKRNNIVSSLDSVRKICLDCINELAGINKEYYWLNYSEASVYCGRLLVDTPIVSNINVYSEGHNNMTLAYDAVKSNFDGKKPSRCYDTLKQSIVQSRGNFINTEDVAKDICQCQLLMYRAYMYAHRKNSYDKPEILESDYRDLILAGELLNALPLDYHWQASKLLWDYSLICIRRFAISAEAGTLWRVNDKLEYMRLLNAVSKDIIELSEKIAIPTSYMYHLSYYWAAQAQQSLALMYSKYLTSNLLSSELQHEYWELMKGHISLGISYFETGINLGMSLANEQQGVSAACRRNHNEWLESRFDFLASWSKQMMYLAPEDAAEQFIIEYELPLDYCV